ncbi:MAG: c-type cytochrome, partial [Methylococcales bacterium]|nr:c-type cytochrome [Methylococcales bacterium]
EKYKIPVPKTQKKIGVGDAKEFEDGVISITVLSVERSSVELSVNEGETLSLDSSKLQLVPIDDATMCTLAYLGKSGAKAIMSARCDPMTEELLAAAEAQAASSGQEVVKPMDLIEQGARGELVNPYTDDPQAIEEGRSLFFANSCNGCHGGTGGGGMGPPLSNSVWVYGAADDTLFRLVILGSDGLLAEGYNREARETVVGPMPSFGKIIENSDHLWKILAFIRSFYNGDPDKRTW